MLLLLISFHMLVLCVFPISISFCLTCPEGLKCVILACQFPVMDLEAGQGVALVEGGFSVSFRFMIEGG